ncbi:MAG: alpha-L-fucosidase [Prevotella sp.]
MKRRLFIAAGLFATLLASAQTKSLHQLQQEFEDLRFGMFNHWAIPTYVEADWSDPDQSPIVIDAPKFDCNQWAKAAKSANMTYGCLSVKHHNGLCMWDTKTTDYNIMHSKLGRDVVREYCDAFRKQGMKIMFHFSVLDTHNRLRRHKITPDKIKMMKDQITELLTNYGEVTAFMFDGWEAPWGRISYDDVSFPEVYKLIKSLQPNCLVIDMNSHKYPREELFYSDIKFYEQGAGQKIDANTNHLPAMACLPIQDSWFWKTDMPGKDVKDPKWLVNDILAPYGKAHCSFVLNAAPNRDGLIDANALKALKEIGRLNRDDVKKHYTVPENPAPVVQKNLALNMPSESSWSDDTQIMDYANDDNFNSAWYSVPSVKSPWWMVELGRDCATDMVVLTEPKGGVIEAYKIECRTMSGEWKTLFEGEAPTKSRVKIHRFPTTLAAFVRVTITRSNEAPAIAELGVYQPL